MSPLSSAQIFLRYTNIWTRWKSRCTRWSFSICSTQSVLRTRLSIWSVKSLRFCTKNCRVTYCLRFWFPISASIVACCHETGPNDTALHYRRHGSRWYAGQLYASHSSGMSCSSLLLTFAHPGLPWRDSTAPSIQDQENLPELGVSFDLHLWPLVWLWSLLCFRLPSVFSNYICCTCAKNISIRILRRKPDDA